MAAAGAPSRRSTLTPWGDRITPRGRRPAIAVRPVQACAEETAGRGAHPAREPALVLSERILWDLQAYLDRAARRGAFLHVAERAQQVAHGLVGPQHETREAREARAGQRAARQRAAVAQLNVAHADRTIAHTECPPRCTRRRPPRRASRPARGRWRTRAGRRPRARRRGTAAVTLRSCPAGGPSSRTNAGARPATRFMRTRSCWESWPSRWRPRSRSCR